MRRETPSPPLDVLVSPYTGLVRSLVDRLPARGDAALVTAAATLASTDEVLGATTVAHTGGVAAAAVDARTAALGEAVERYAAAADGRHERTPTTAAEHEAALDPGRFRLFLAEQLATPGFPFVAYTPDTRLRLTEAVDLATGRAVLVPSQLVYLARPPDDEEPIAYPTSNGLACAPTVEEAVLAGLLELIERDAFMLVWTNRLSLPLLDWTDDPALDAFVRRHLARAGCTFAAVDASCFLGVPAALGVVRAPVADAGLLGVGAAAAPTIEIAARKALTEAFAVRSGARDLALAAEAIPDAAAIRDFDEHVLYYCDAANAERARFLADSTERRPVAAVAPLAGETARDLVDEIVALLGAHGVSVYAADVTTPDVRELGLAVVRVLSPELCPLDVIHLARFLGPPRLFRAAYELGLRDAPLTLSTANHDPHPFP